MSQRYSALRELSLQKLGPARLLYRLEELMLAVTQTFHQVALLLQPGVSEKGHPAKELKPGWCIEQTLGSSMI